MGLLSRLFGAGAAGPPPDWLEARPGERVRDPAGRGSVVGSAAVYDLRVQDGGPGDAEAVAIVWTERSRQTSMWVVQQDVYGGPDPGTVVVVSALEPDAHAWAATRGLPAGEGLVAIEHPRHGAMEGERQACTLRRGDGPYAGDCPSEGTVTIFFRTGSREVGRFLLVLADRHGSPCVIGMARRP